jgi:hypothetical protein
MRLVTSGLVIALLVFTVQQSTGQEVLISEPEINDTTVTVSGYVVPERPGGVEAAKRSGVLVEGMGEKGLVGLLAWEVAFIVIVFLFPIVFKDGTVTWESRVSTHWTTEDELEVDLPQPWASGSAMVVIDRHAGTWAAVHEPLTKRRGASGGTLPARRIPRRFRVDRDHRVGAWRRTVCDLRDTRRPDHPIPS